MLVSSANDVKIYNLSAGKSLPEWLSDRKRRKLNQQDVDIRRRIELIQDFSMPDVSSCVTMSQDKEYIFVTGAYKPRVRCFDVHNLSMKFERCLDASVIKMLTLGDGFEKLIFLEDERFVEFHVKYGHYHRTRIPKFGRDIKYHSQSASLIIVGSGPDIYRLNMEQGRFLAPLSTDATSLTCCELCVDHDLLLCGTADGNVEAWDARSRQRVGLLDCALAFQLSAVSALKAVSPLTIAVGTEDGKILMYDIRSSKALLIKDHQNELAIRALDVSSDGQTMLSMDRRIVKLWHRDSGRPFAAIEPGTDLNDLCLIPGTGLMFMANEAPKVLTYYVPSLGAAPRWCAFLDNITEELEEDAQPAGSPQPPPPLRERLPSVYDDYKFVTTQQLDELGLAHLVGSNMLRAYMHGYFMDARLHKKAQQLANPFAFDEYRRSKVKAKLAEERSARPAASQRLPAVNRDLALRLHLDAEDGADSKRKKRVCSLGVGGGWASGARVQAQSAAGLLQDDRFKALFEKTDFEVDPESEEFRLMNPALQKLQRTKRKRQDRLLQQKFAAVDEPSADADVKDELEGRASSDESDQASSSEDDQEFAEQMKSAHKHLRQTKQRAEDRRDVGERLAATACAPTLRQSAPAKARLFELRAGEELRELSAEMREAKGRRQLERLSLGSRLHADGDASSASRSKEVSFALERQTREIDTADKKAQHVRERRQAKRSADSINRALGFASAPRGRGGRGSGRGRGRSRF